MPLKIDTLRDAYGSFKGDDAYHGLRAFGIVASAFAVALYAGDLSSSAVPAMSLAVSVLAGFTFTALFSNDLLSFSDMPVPKNESDRIDLATLRTVADNFRFRARLFLVSAVFCLVLFLLLAIPFRSSLLSEHLAWLVPSFAEFILGKFLLLHSFLSFTVAFLAIAVFFELLYLFYRLSESIFTILRIRRNYHEG